MAARQRDVKVRILSEYYDAGSKAAERATRRLAQFQMAAAQEEIAREQAKAAAVIAANRAQGQAMETFGRRTLAVSAAIAIGLGIATKAAIDWESAWAGVRKVVDGSEPEMAALEQQLRGLALVLPAAHEEIARVAETAGQLGVAREDIAAFTRTAINMGETTNMAADEAATSMAQLGNIMGIGADQADEMGSAIVQLGNNGASTERDIVSMALRIAGAGRTVGLTTDQVLSISSALASVGMEVEAGGTAMSRVLLQIDRDVETGADTLATYAQVSGMSASQFAEAWGKDAAGALTAFLTGLGKVQATGGSTTAILDTLGFTEIRVSDALRRAALSGELLNDALGIGAQAWQDNIALTEEANKRYQTLESRLELARNQINDPAIDIGGVLMPIVADGADAVASLAAGFASLPEPVQEWATKLGLAAAGVSGVVGAASIVIPKLNELKTTVEALRGGTSLLGRALGGTASVLTGPWGLAIAGAVTILGFWIKSQGDAKRETDQMVDTLDQHTAAITENTRALAFNKLEADGVVDAAKRAGISLEDLVDAAVDPTSDAFTKLTVRQREYLDLLEAHQGDYGALGGIAEANEDLNTVLNAVAGTQDLVADSQARVRDQMAAGLSTTDDATAAQEDLAGAMAETNVVLEDGRVLVEDAAAALETLTKALDDLNSPTLNAREAERKFHDALAGVSAAVQQQIDDLASLYESQGMSAEAARERAEAEVAVADKLDVSTEAGRRNQGALDAIAEAGMRRATAILEQTGSEEAFRASLESARLSLLDQARQFFATEEEAQAYVDTVLSVPAEVITEAEMKTEQAQADFDAMIERNQGKRIRVTAEISTSGQPVYVTAAGTKMERAGGTLDFYAAGDIRNGHVADIVPAGSWRVFGEDETGGEGYVPLANDWRRPRAEAVLDEIANRFGGQYITAADRLGGPQVVVTGGGASAGDLAAAMNGMTLTLVTEAGPIRAMVRAEVSGAQASRTATLRQGMH